MTNLSDTLAALSAAATQGPMSILPGANCYSFDGRLMVGGKCIAFVDGDVTQDEDGEYHIVLEADGLLLVELWNAYRTGQLVPVPSVETIAKEIYLAVEMNGTEPRDSDHMKVVFGPASLPDYRKYGDRSRKAAIAVIAAMKEGRTDD